MRQWLFALVASLGFGTGGVAADPWLTFEGGEGPGKGKHVVLISGDEEYRSEEALPMLAKILSTRHGFKCTVLFAIDPKDGTVAPNVTDNIPGLEALKTADLMLVSLRYRTLPDEQFRHIAAYLDAGKPVVGLRTSTHAFKPGTKGRYAKYNSNAFGKQILGETWVNHHGQHGKEGTRGLFTDAGKAHPILRGVAPGTVFGTSDVYTINLPLAASAATLVLGEVTETLKPDSKAVAGKKNDPMMPVAWTKTYGDAGKLGRVFTTTMGASQDCEFEGTRRMIVNACFWAVGLEEKIPAASDVTYVGDYKPTRFQFRKDAEWKPGKFPADYAK
jgi:type 1 glutamine amidotransferase